MKLLIVTCALITGCSVHPQRAASVSTAALAGHITTAQQGVTAAQANLSEIDSKTIAIEKLLHP